MRISKTVSSCFHHSCTLKIPESWALTVIFIIVRNFSDLMIVRWYFLKDELLSKWNSTERGGNFVIRTGRQICLKDNSGVLGASLFHLPMSSIHYMWICLYFLKIKECNFWIQNSSGCRRTLHLCKTISLCVFLLSKGRSRSGSAKRNQTCCLFHWLFQKVVFFLKWRLIWPQSELLFTFSDYVTNTEESLPVSETVELSYFKITFCGIFVAGM